MQITNIYEAKSHLSKLVDLASHGEEVIICKPGYWKGKVKISEDFDELPKRITAAFRGDVH